MVLDQLVREGFLEKMTIGPKVEFGPGTRQTTVSEKREQLVQRLGLQDKYTDWAA